MMDESYYPETFMTIELVDEVFSKYDWLSSYQIEDDLPDGIIISFPKCNLLLTEYGEGDVTIKFLDTDSLYDYTLGITEALLIIKYNLKEDNAPILNEELIPFASQEKVKIQLHNLCKLLQHYLLSCIQGDFSWVNDYIRNKVNL